MVHFWCAGFSRFAQSFSRFVRDINGEKKKHLVIDDSFSRLVFFTVCPPSRLTINHYCYALCLPLGNSTPSIPEASFPSHLQVRKISEQLPCRSAEVKFFSVFLCQRCREIWREILVKFSVLRFPGFGCATENFTSKTV